MPSDVDKLLEDEVVSEYESGISAAMLGAGQVYATDINNSLLRLLDYGIKEARLDSAVEAACLVCLVPIRYRRLMLYWLPIYFAMKSLECRSGKRLMESLNMPQEQRSGIIVTDSQRFYGTDFVPLLHVNKERERVGRPTIEWEERFEGNDFRNFG